MPIGPSSSISAFGATGIMIYPMSFVWRSITARGLVILTAAVPLVVTCQANPPRILEVFWQVNDVFDRVVDDVRQELSVFVHTEDADGIEDIETIYVINDKEELYWTLNRETWAQRNELGITWIGSSSLILQGRQEYPAGRYRVIVQDLSGEFDEVSFSVDFDHSPPPARSFPSVSITEDTLSVAASQNRVQVWVFEDEALLKAFVTDAVLPLDTLQGSAPGRKNFKLYVYIRDSTLGTGVIAGPYFWSAAETSSQ